MSTGRHNPDSFLEGPIECLMTPGKSPDPSWKSTFADGSGTIPADFLLIVVPNVRDRFQYFFVIQL